MTKLENEFVAQQKINTDFRNMNQIKMEEYVDKLTDIKDDLATLLSELRHHMNKIYNLDYMLKTANMLEDNFLKLEKEFIEEFKTSKIEE